MYDYYLIWIHKFCRFHSFENSEEGILEGEQLELALKNMKVSQDEHVSEAQLE